MSSVAHKDNSPDSLKRTPWRNWLLVGWIVGIFALFLRFTGILDFFLRFVIEMLS